MSKKQQRIIKRRRQLLVFVLALITIVSTLILGSFNTMAKNEKEAYKYFESYEVKPGDSLWSIADEYITPEYRDKEEYIAEIKQMNHMLDDDLSAGDFLIVSYYAYDEL